VAIVSSPTGRRKGNRVDLLELASEFVLGAIPSDDLGDRACDALLAGYESPTLGALAGAEKDVHPADLKASFAKGLEELGVELPDRLGARAGVRRVRGAPAEPSVPWRIELGLPSSRPAR